MQKRKNFKIGKYSFNFRESIFGKFLAPFFQSSNRNWIGFFVSTGLLIGLLVFTELTIVDIFFWIFFFVMFWWQIDSRVSIGGALVCLVIIPFLLVLGNKEIFLKGEAWAEVVAVWAYFFLVIGVAKQIWEYKKEAK